jgi:predicted nucleic acid-binding protein
MPGSFIDTNVLDYLASGNPAKANRAERIAAAGGTINVQVLNELANVSRRKMGLSCVAGCEDPPLFGGGCERRV